MTESCIVGRVSREGSKRCLLESVPPAQTARLMDVYSVRDLSALTASVRHSRKHCDAGVDSLQ